MTNNAILADGCNPGEGQRRVSDPAGATPAAPLATTLSFRRGEGLHSSWAIIKKGDDIFAEEPISHDLCDALLTRDRLLRDAFAVVQYYDTFSAVALAAAIKKVLDVV